jgi:cyclic-di-AMP phosphodiesterase PgpH
MANEKRSSQSVFHTSRLARGGALRKVLDNVFMQFLAFAAFVGAIVAILTAGLDDRGQITEDLVGQVAATSVEASRDFAFRESDEVATDRLRDELARTVPSVYDWQEGLGGVMEDQLREAFRTIRSALAEESHRTLREQDPERLQWLENRVEDPADREQALLQALPEATRIQLAGELRTQAFDAMLDANISESDYRTFAANAFPPHAEEAVVAIVRDVMSNLIVANPQRIEQEREHGIYLRRLRDEQLLIEYHVTDLEGRFVGLDGVEPLIVDASRQQLIGVGGDQLRGAITSTAAALIRPNTSFNQAITRQKREIARDSVPEQVLSEEFRQGQIVVEKGHLITERHVRILEEMIRGEERHQASQLLVGLAVFSLLLLLILFVFGRRNIRAFKPTPRDIVFMGTALLAMLLLTRALAAVSHALSEQFGAIPVEAWYFAIPVAAGGMLIRLVLDSEHAIIFSILFAVLVGVIAESSLFFFAHTLIGSLVGITTVQQVKHRMALMWSGVAVGAVNSIGVLGFLLIQGELFQITTLAYVLLGFTGGLAAGFFISAVLPVFESIFGYTTDIKLLELANLNHPLLRELIFRSPGSYQHSMMVGSLCEAAAEAIGCNSLLARVGSYYHDIGKAKNPQYFAENQKLGENPHDKLKPNMSALIIKSHVKDGLDMARQYRLPEEIQDFIAQHHGTSLIAYFYHKAKAAEDPDIPEVAEKDFRYPGPRPQSRETAICLLADGVEAASRAMPNPSPARLKGLVQTMINKAFTDGQLDECDLTLKDLNKIARAFTRILTAIYHHRPEYPGEKKGSTESRRRKETDKVATTAADGAEAEATAEKEKNGGRGADSGGGNGAGSRGSDRRGDQSTPRGDLPRLGTS